MPSWIAKFFTGLLTEWAGKAIKYLFDFLKNLKEQKEETKEHNERIDQALLVQNISDEIQALIKENKPVPKELKDRLREESRKLINSTSNIGSNS